jgi:hypothetical protein
MRTYATITRSILLAFCSCLIPAMTGEQLSPAQRTETLWDYGIDPSTPLESRIGETPTTVLKMFADAEQAKPTAHVLTDTERRKVKAALGVLTPLHRRILRERLRSISFLDGMPNTALTSTVNPNEPYKVFDLIIRAGILDEDVSEFLTQKERTCFETAGSSLSVSIEGGALDAIVYVLLHEATHMADASLGIMFGTGPNNRPEGSPASSFADGIWSERLTPAPEHRDALLETIRFRAGGKVLNVSHAQEVYQALSRTPFVSLYASGNWHDDLAEFVAWYHLTQRLKQPYRLEIRKNAKIIYTYEPMESHLVRGRFNQMSRFYESEH